MKKKSDRQSKHVFIIGAKGLGGYGGFETFVRKLAEYSGTQEQEEKPKLVYHFCCKENGYGSYDEQLMEHVQELGKHDFLYCGVHCHKIRVPEIGAAQAVLYDLFSLIWAVRTGIRYRLSKPVFYLLSCRLGLVIDFLAWIIHGFGGRVYLNPDGHEWMREKWSLPVRKYLKFSEARMAGCADLVICDSRAIQEYIRTEYAPEKGRTMFIPYGAELFQAPDPGTEKRAEQWLSQHSLISHEYYLMISRLVPENSYEYIVREFMHSHSNKKLLMITTENSRLKKKLERKYHYLSDPRIMFVDAVYDESLLNAIRQHAYAYIHGHTVGGTNPGLLEAMATQCFCLVLDVAFNRETAGDAALYWKKEPGSLAGLIDAADKADPEFVQQIKISAGRRMQKEYRWEEIAAAYEKAFRHGA